MNENFLGFQLPDFGAGYGMSAPASTTAPVATAADVGGSVAAGAGGYQPLQLGFNMPTLQLGFQGLGALGSLYDSFQSTKLARDAFNFNKSLAERNLANSIKSYNTALTDRATSRGFVQGDSKEKTQQYINDNRL
ncbi:MAG: hypothetical protein ACK5LG_22000 [Bacteroides thetaiotaomicron]